MCGLLKIELIRVSIFSIYYRNATNSTIFDELKDGFYFPFPPPTGIPTPSPPNPIDNLQFSSLDNPLVMARLRFKKKNKNELGVNYL